MACGCGGGGSKRSSKRIIGQPRIFAQPQNKEVVNIPPPSGTGINRQRIKKLREEAKLRSLGKI